jgi:ABC-type branched-subunit amino acid transport system substrate-binding protein
VLDSVGYQTGATDFSPVITKVKGHKPDAIFVSSLMNESLGAAKELERQGLNVPVLSNALTWSGAFSNASGSAGENWHTIGYLTNEPDPKNEKAVRLTKEFLKRSETNSSIQQPANIASSAPAYDAVLMIADVLRDGKVSGDTPVQEARDILQRDFQQIKNYNKGWNEFSMLPNSDGYILSRVLKLDVDKKIWVDIK